MTVEVRDAATGAPVSGAVVDARPLHFFLPDYPHAIFDPSAPEGDRAITGDDGAARLAVIVDHPVEIVVCAPGYGTVCAELIEHPASSDEQCPWFEPNSVGGAEAPVVELRFGRAE